YIATSNLTGLTALVCFYASNAVAGWIMQYRQALILERVAQRCLRDLRQALFTHLMRLDLAFYDRNAIGRLMSRVQNDVGNLQDLVTRGMLGTIGGFVTLDGILVVMLSMHPLLTLITFTVVPPMVLITFYWRTRARHAFGQVRRALAQVNAGLQERSEEHTSELQSRSDLVCRLLLEKKKKNIPESITPPACLIQTPHTNFISLDCCPADYHRASSASHTHSADDHSATLYNPITASLT